MTHKDRRWNFRLSGPPQILKIHNIPEQMTPIHAAGLAPQEQSEGDYEISMFKIIREILKRKE